MHSTIPHAEVPAPIGIRTGAPAVPTVPVEVSLVLLPRRGHQDAETLRHAQVTVPVGYIHREVHA